ncbi:MAG: tRNA preQ1(34) S-adenosylmethionine ribosyltransferase-isomerase QueA [Abyssibacter sp.]|uniref:tRNA preQ1(34) S-adenosylmethionine ribosyltransferase-isomerase QueA n=1 Tax=Abyssibacter sp. TaxID=2320200 RepID=UPI002EA02FD9|nr:tRNA preQ1(34) S-adenosylmethionine ribosyltransferase-isomerase QueA [Pseudomonadota bacterium]
MQKSDFHYELPEQLIAQHPLPDRSGARLLDVDGQSGELRDARVVDLPERLHPGDLVVTNDVRVMPARVFGRKSSGGRVEVMIERLVQKDLAWAHLRVSKAPKPGGRLVLEGGHEVEVRGRQEDGLFVLSLLEGQWSEVLEAVGHMPLPPYIRRADTDEDADRYQTVFARQPGAVAAPTAGLHFDDALMAAMRARGVSFAATTLWVGAGTFQPVRSDRIEDHRMHAERVQVPAETVAAIEATRARGGRVVAIGTTVVRALESAAAGGRLEPMDGDTRLFIKPGDRFRVVDALFTNFHLPESTLLMLVCAFAGYDAVMRAYRHAVQEQYRFFSYGDAMWLTPQPDART